MQAKASLNLSEPWLHAQFALRQPSLPRAKDSACWADLEGAGSSPGPGFNQRSWLRSSGEGWDGDGVLRAA